MNRITEITKYVAKGSLSIEIAPYFSPLLKRSDGYNVLILDVFDKQTLVENALKDPNITDDKVALIDDVDFVADACEIGAVIEASEFQGKIDTILSSHNFEHLPNPIKFLQGCSTALKDGGMLSMAIPDYRACFDHFRFPTRLSDWIAAFKFDHNKPSASSLFDFKLNNCLYENTNLSRSVGCDIRTGDPSRFVPTGDINSIYLDFEAHDESSPYEDAHVSVLTPDIMLLHLIDLINLKLIDFEIVEISDTFGLEFYVHLKNKKNLPLQNYSLQRKNLLLKINKELGSSVYSQKNYGSCSLDPTKANKIEVPVDFEPKIYLELHPDVRNAGINPANHYIEHGFNEGRAYKKSNSSSLEEVFAAHLTIPPVEKNSFDLFPGSWSTILDGMTGGHFDGTRDARVDWLLQQVDVNGFNILELGPLEAAHTAMLEKRGGNIVAIESNIGAFLRCLVVKNYLNLQAKFMLGNFEQMDFPNQSYDLVMASGVLYHLKDPVDFLCRISPTTQRLFIWTHYFEPDLSLWSAGLEALLQDGKWDHKNPILKRVGAQQYRLVKQSYADALGWTGFCGGTDIYSHWIYKQDLLDLLTHNGFNKVDVAFDAVDHPNGPSFCLYCEK